MFPKVEQKRKGVLVQQVRYLVPCPGTRKCLYRKTENWYNTVLEEESQCPQLPDGKWIPDMLKILSEFGELSADFSEKGIQI